MRATGPSAPDATEFKEGLKTRFSTLQKPKLKTEGLPCKNRSKTAFFLFSSLFGAYFSRAPLQDLHNDDQHNARSDYMEFSLIWPSTTSATSAGKPKTGAQ